MHEQKSPLAWLAEHLGLNKKADDRDYYGEFTQACHDLLCACPKCGGTNPAEAINCQDEFHSQQARDEWAAHVARQRVATTEMYAAQDEATRKRNARWRAEAVEAYRLEYSEEGPCPDL